MARLLRPLRQWPPTRHPTYCCQTAFSYLHSTPTAVTSSQITYSPCLSFATLPSSHQRLPTQPRGVRSPNYISPFAPEEAGNNSDSDADVNKSRNQKKREARRAVRWGMELASFSALQIKRIIRAASLEREVFDALMLVKRLGPDVREGKRRQFNYIGKLLRDVQPDLMDALIHSTKDGDWSRLQAFAGSVAGSVVVDNEELRETEYDDYDDEEEEEEVAQECIELAIRWLNGLINNDENVTSEVYAITSVDFDRQELRKLVRRVHTAQERKDIDTENEQKVEATVTSAEKSLARFLRAIAKQMTSDPDFIDL